MENIAILTGGDSAEYNISLLSANTVLKHLNKAKYNGFIVHLKNGRYTVDSKEINTRNFSFKKENQNIIIDKVFIALHGPPAENGLIQNYLDSIKIPYTACNADISALTFDKYNCNRKLRSLGFNSAESVLISKENTLNNKEILESIRLPCFIKPNGAGSSHGISKVVNREELEAAIDRAYKHDNKVIIEDFIKGIEVSCGVYFDGLNIKALPITEIISENDFFDYEAKYEGKSEEITPARISRKITNKIQKTTIDIYKKMFLSGICRIDYIIQNEQVFIIEINTIPGLSEESILPKQLKAANINLSEVFDLCLNNIN
ncbi:MAG: D-alanine--D-alanine ligase [Flavobacteriales bacterium]|nr:D-alanine--D-alanine ligase [Flavobacteriales bacterium]|tara:strand:+ start:1479 stop:2432 length:954 start_codon:yes stop_codon:yes gene_type:complete